MSDIRLIIVGSFVIFAGLYVGGMAGSQYNQFAIQKAQFDECYDYSSGTAVSVNCTQKQEEALPYFAVSIVLIGGGAVILVKGIKGKWDQNVKSDEMVGPKHG